MTICKPSAFFRTTGTPLVNMISGFCFRAFLACVVSASSIALHPDPAWAMQAVAQPGANPQFASLQAIKRCAGATCTALGMLVDPAADPPIKSFHLELQFDPTLFTFDPAPTLTGPLCAFAAGGSPCPPVSASLGTSLIPEDDTPPGVLPEGGSFSFSVTPISPEPATFTSSVTPMDADLLTVDVTLPAGVDLSTDQNVFELAFDLVTPVPIDVPLIATYFGTPGARQFTQDAFACNGSSTACTGVPNVLGVDVATAVPEPASATILGVALAAFGFAGSVARRRRLGIFAGEAPIGAK
jgi:hypothetical protein